MTPYDDDRVTGVSFPSANVRTVPPPDDDVPHEIGKLMAAQAATDRRVEAYQREMATLVREVGALRRDLELDRHGLVTDASKQAAKRTGNRLALTMSGLFALYEAIAPTLQEYAPTLKAIWKVMHHG